ncbi:hypothetical protein IAQ61_000763 [Plenodomus lingam]|uniref:uncharacterized protein n=1 Tax=Leptosphaeria maculans TaxID=5022 RepID=UPI003331F123|nr:hypothetical protein IAQ61_000763 [Plenodomus lingam]
MAWDNEVVAAVAEASSTNSAVQATMTSIVMDNDKEMSNNSLLSMDGLFTEIMRAKMIITRTAARTIMLQDTQGGSLWLLLDLR